MLEETENEVTRIINKQEKLQHEADEKFGIKRPINIDHIVCF